MNAAIVHAILVGPYYILGGWLIYSIFTLIRYKYANPYILQLIPSVFTTIGIFGTFIGIFYGLYNFDVNNITESIPELLEGMKTAFLTSIIGIVLSVIFSYWIANVSKIIDEKVPAKPNDELAALNKLIELNTKAIEVQQVLNNSFENGIRSLKTTLDSQMKESREQHESVQASQIKYLDQLSKIEQIQNNTADQLSKLRTEQSAYAKEAKEHTRNIIEKMTASNQLVREKFEEFGRLLAESNTKALVEAMEKVITDFNEQMNELISRLVKENFEELNNSVKQLNHWQQENKQQVATLISQFKDVSNNLQVSSSTIREIADNTNKLTADNGQLAKLIQELEEVLIKNPKFGEIIDSVQQSTSMLKDAAGEIENAKNTLNQFTVRQSQFNDQITVLISRLQEIEKIKDLNGEFWNQTKHQMNEGVSIIKIANQKLANDVKEIDGKFYERLNTTLASLDELIRQFILSTQRRVN